MRLPLSATEVDDISPWTESHIETNYVKNVYVSDTLIHDQDQVQDQIYILSLNLHQGVFKLSFKKIKVASRGWTHNTLEVRCLSNWANQTCVTLQTFNWHVPFHFLDLDLF